MLRVMDPGNDPQRLSESLGSPQWLSHLIDTHPATAEGLARLVDAATTPGALAASTKWLFMSAVASAKAQPDLVERCLHRAAAEGTTRDEAEGAALTLLVSRGIPPFRLMADHIEKAFEDEATVGRPITQEAIDVDEVRRYAASVYGNVPERIELMAGELPRAMEGFLLLRRGGLRGTGLSAMDTELLLVAINSALYEEEFVTQHAAAARREGATDTELAEAVATAVPFGGLAAWRPGAAGIIASRS